MAVLDETRVQWECQQLLNRAALLMDSAEWETLAGCYAEDAILSRPSDPDNPIIGRDQILASFHARPPRTTCHMLTNSVFTVNTADSVEAISRVVLMSGPAATGSGVVFPLAADPALMAGTFRDSLVRHNGKWLIQRRDGDIQLKYVYPV